MGEIMDVTNHNPKTELKNSSVAPLTALQLEPSVRVNDFPIHEAKPLENNANILGRVRHCAFCVTATPTGFSLFRPVSMGAR
jgi:hypothetical protein